MAISGKPREHCVQALQAAFGDPDRAFDYLSLGIPPEMLNPAGMAQLAAGGLGQGVGGQEMDYGDEDVEGDEDFGDGSLEGLSSFVNNPQFQQIRQ